MAENNQSVIQDSVRIESKIMALWYTQAEWSRRTFGSDNIRGPVGPLLHLRKEAKEAAVAASYGKNNLLAELADCYLLLQDATRRAGYTFDELLEAAISKQQINMTQRTWPPIETMKNDEPVEHIKQPGDVSDPDARWLH